MAFHQSCLFSALALALAAVEAGTDCVKEVPERNPNTLIDKMKRNAIEKCPMIMSKDMPNEYLWSTNASVPLLVTINMALFRFNGIDDLKQELSLFAALGVNWQFNCPMSCKDVIPMGHEGFCSGDGEAGANFRIDPQCTWKPGLVHRNAAEDFMPMETRMRPLYVYFDGERPRVLWFSLVTLVSRCDAFAFKKFPFDELNCEMVFETDDDGNLVNLTVEKFEIDTSAESNFIGDTEVWSLVSLNHSRKDTIQFGGGTVPQVTLTVRFKRKYHYYISIVFLPTFGLFFLVIAIMIMPPKIADRPGLGMTVVLAFSVILALVFGMIPQTSETVYVVLLVSFKFGGSCFLTVYMLFACEYARKDAANQKRKVPLLGPIPKVRIMDIFVCAIYGFAFFVIDFSLFYLMICTE